MNRVANMVLKVYGHRQSICTRRVLTTLIEKNVPYELVNVDFIVAREHKTESFLKLHPFGKIPVLEDDGVLIYESRAIAKYIAKKFAGQGTKLIPADDDLKKYGLLARSKLRNFDGPASGIVFEKAFKKYLGFGEPNETLVVKYATNLDEVFAVYNGILEKQAYLAGDEVTLADLFHLPYGKLMKDAGGADLFLKYPNVNKWFSELEKRDSWIKVNEL